MPPSPRQFHLFHTSLPPSIISPLYIYVYPSVRQTSPFGCEIVLIGHRRIFQPVLLQDVKELAVQEQVEKTRLTWWINQDMTRTLMKFWSDLKSPIARGRRVKSRHSFANILSYVNRLYHGNFETEKGRELLRKREMECEVLSNMLWLLLLVIIWFTALVFDDVHVLRDITYAT